MVAEEGAPSDFGKELEVGVGGSGTMIRVYFKERPPVGCIPVIDHLELNVSPLSINLTNSFYQMMMKFFFNNQANTTANNNSNSNSGMVNSLNNNSASNLGSGRDG